MVFGAIASASLLPTVFSLSLLPEHAVFLPGTKSKLWPLSFLSFLSRMLFLFSPLFHSPIQLSTPPKAFPHSPQPLGSSVV